MRKVHSHTGSDGAFHYWFTNDACAAVPELAAAAAAPLMQIVNVRVNVFHGPGKETDTFVLGGVCSSQPAEDCRLSQFLAA